MDENIRMATDIFRHVRYQLAATIAGVVYMSGSLAFANDTNFDQYMFDSPPIQATLLASSLLDSEATAEEEADALDALAEGDTEGALEKLQHAVSTDANNDDARFDLLKLPDLGGVLPMMR